MQEPSPQLCPGAGTQLAGWRQTLSPLGEAILQPSGRVVPGGLGSQCISVYTSKLAELQVPMAMLLAI